MVPGMRATGNLICNMGLVRKFGLMVRVTKEIMSMERSLVKVLMCGLMEAHMMETG